MVYLERTPAAPLDRLVSTLWYCSAPHLPQGRQRVLPNGNLQIIINLADDSIREFRDDSPTSEYAVSPTILTGLQTRYEWIDTRDLRELVGVLFLPGGASPFFRENAEHFRSRTLSLQDMLPLNDLRGRLQQNATPQEKLSTVEAWLTSHMRSDVDRLPLAVRALKLLRANSVQDTARMIGCSERRLHAAITTEVGLSPKAWSRLQRFQAALQALHAGSDMRWEELALECGFYDQSHFSNEFKAFAGIDPSTYTRASRPWASHVEEP